MLNAQSHPLGQGHGTMGHGTEGETGINDRREMDLRVKMIREMNVRW